MTSNEMLREFKVGLDRIDSSSYPEIYDEQIYMFINRFITRLVNEGRKVFEETQVITDNLKSLVFIQTIQSSVNPKDITQFVFDLSGLEYYFYLSSYARTFITSDIKGRATIKVTQLDDIDSVLLDPFNKPKPYKVPVTFARDSIIAYTDGRFKVEELVLTFIKKPLIVSKDESCDLDEQLHYSIVEGAIELAQEALGIRAQELNKQ